jgi:CheY-like chemotaxis protein
MRNVYALSSLLEQYKMNVAVAINGKEALRKNKRVIFDIILMDIVSPEVNGAAAIQEIRKQDKRRTTPIIIQTSNKEKNEKCLQLGASGFITKPVNHEQLLSLLEVWLYKD